MPRIQNDGFRAYSYKEIVPPANGAVNLETLKKHLRISSCNQDDILQVYLDAATLQAEDCTGLDLITRTYQTERDFFPNWPSEGYYISGAIPQTLNTSSGNVGFQLRRGPVQAVSLVEYIEVGTVDTYITVDSSDYYVTIPEAGKLTDILLEPDSLWPTDFSPRQNSIRITFTSGFGDEQKDVPSDIQLAILETASQLYANRGDCAGNSCGNAIPAIASNIYKKHRVISF